MSVGMQPQGFLKSKRLFHKALSKPNNFQRRSTFAPFNFLTIVMYCWRLFHNLRSERYKLLIMPVIKFDMGKERGRNMQILKEIFYFEAYNMFSFSIYRYSELGGQICCIMWVQNRGLCRNVL